MGTTNILDMNNRINALEKGVTSVEEAVDEVASGLITLHGYTDISASVLDISSFTATDNCILLLNSKGTDNTKPYFNYLINSVSYETVGVLNASLDRYVFLRKGDVFKFNDTYPYENTLTNYVYLI